jgi:hypothetical protein
MNAQKKGNMIRVIGRKNAMLVLKHVEYQIVDAIQLEGLLSHLRETTAQVEGITYKDIHFVKGKKEFVLSLECDREDRYHAWRQICPPPPGAKDWHEVLLTKDERFGNSLDRLPA